MEIGECITKLQSVKKWIIFFETQQILTFQFLEVVRQHISGEVDNVMYHFVANLTGFPAVKEL